MQYSYANSYMCAVYAIKTYLCQYVSVKLSFLNPAVTIWFTKLHDMASCILVLIK